MSKIIFLTLLLILPVSAGEPKHINPPVNINGTTVTMDLEFWKHVVDTMEWQNNKINEQQNEILNLQHQNKLHKDCT